MEIVSNAVLSYSFKARVSKSLTQSDVTPPSLTVLTRQSTNPSYIFLSVGWFISLVRIMSHGATVQVMKKPEIMPEQNTVRGSLRSQPELRGASCEQRTTETRHIEIPIRWILTDWSRSLWQYHSNPFSLHSTRMRDQCSLEVRGRSQQCPDLCRGCLQEFLVAQLFRC